VDGRAKPTAVRLREIGCLQRSIYNPRSPWPGLTRPSTSLDLDDLGGQNVDARNKSGQSVLEVSAWLWTLDPAFSQPLNRTAVGPDPRVMPRAKGPPATTVEGIIIRTRAEYWPFSLSTLPISREGVIEQVLECSRQRRSSGDWSGSPVDRPLLGRQRVILLCGILLVVEIVFFIFFVAGTHGLIVPLKRPTSTDFISFYAAGKLANASTPALAYDQDAHYAAEQRATASGIDYFLFYYPPPFLLLCAALARLPYIPAFIGFEIATIGFYVLIVRRILDESGWEILVPILAFPPVLWTIGLGQNGFLTAGLFGAATLLVDRRPFAAGLLFGGLCCKPHFAMLVPVALIAGRHWRVLLGALISGGGLCLLSVIAFGWQTWHDFLIAAAASPGVYASGRIPFGGFVTPFGAALLLGAPPGAAAVVQAVAAAIAAIFVAIVWRRNLSLPIRAASLISATLVAVPLALFYDLVIAGVAAAWLLRGDGEHRLPEQATLVLAGLYVLCLNPRGIAADWHVPIGMLIVVALTMLTAAVAARRAMRDPAPTTAGE